MPELKQIIFKFDDDTERVLEGEELEFYETTCVLQSDYLLPLSKDAQLGEKFNGIVRGFITA